MRMDLIVRLLGRERAWRLGRGLYMAARGENPNDITTNGEAALMRDCVAAFIGERETGAFIAFDIGANLGSWSEAMLAAAHAASVAAQIELFEPVPGAFTRLEAALGGDAAVRLHQLAVSNRSGSAEMQIVGEFAGTNSLVAQADPAASTLTVQTVTVPEIAARLGHDHIHLLKIDAEGHDLEILRGMVETLVRRAVWVVQFEYNARWLGNAGSLRGVFDLVRGLDYRVCRLTGDGLEVYHAWNAENDRYFENNYALVRADILPRLTHREMHWNDSNVLTHLGAD